MATFLRVIRYFTKIKAQNSKFRHRGEAAEISYKVCTGKVPIVDYPYNIVNIGPTGKVIYIIINI